MGDREGEREAWEETETAEKTKHGGEKGSKGKKGGQSRGLKGYAAQFFFLYRSQYITASKGHGLIETPINSRPTSFSLSTFILLREFTSAGANALRGRRGGQCRARKEG